MNMNLLQAKMFVRSINPSAARILITFLMTRSAMDVQELRDWTGMKRETIYDGLKLLELFGMVASQTHAHGRVVWLPSGDLLPGFQVSPMGTPELQKPRIGTAALVVGEESINSINTDSLNTSSIQESAKGTPDGYPNASRILAKTDLLFDGALVISTDLEDCDPVDVLAWCAYAYAQKNKLSGPGGLVRTRLIKREHPPETARLTWREILPCEFLEALELITYQCDTCQSSFKTQSALEEHQAAHPKRFPCEFCDQIFDQEIDLESHVADEHTPKSLEVEPSALQPINGGMCAERAWESVLGQLQMEMPRASFETWVRDTKAVRYDGNVLSIGVRNAYARDWLESRLKSTVSRLLVGILRGSVDVEFVTE